MHNFNMLFPDFAARCAELRTMLLPVAYVFLVGGMIGTVVTAHRSVETILLMFGRTVVCIILLTQLPSWGGQLSLIADTTVREVIKADPASLYEQYNKALGVQKASSSQASWSDKLFNMPTALFEQGISVVLWLLGLIASVIMFYAYVVQAFILYCGYALSPIFIGFLATRSLTQTGFHYLMELAGVALWPLGWGVASLLTGSLINFMTDQSFLTSFPIGGVQGYGFQNFIGVAFIGLWIIFTTIAAPLIIQRTITTGAQAGAALISGAFTAGTMAIVGGTSAAAAYGSTGGVGGVVAGTAMGVVGGAVAMGESSISGYQYTPTSSMLTALGQMRSTQSGKPKKGQHAQPHPMPVNNDISGDQAVRAKILESKNPHSGTP